MKRVRYFRRERNGRSYAMKKRESEKREIETIRERRGRR